MPVVNQGLPATRVRRHHGCQREHGAEDPDDHQDQAHFVCVEAVLVGLRHRPIENGPNRKGDDADNESTRPNHEVPFRPLCAVPASIGDKPMGWDFTRTCDPVCAPSGYSVRQSGPFINELF